MNNETCGICGIAALEDIGRKWQCNSFTCTIENEFNSMFNELQPPIDLWDKFQESVVGSVNRLERELEKRSL